MATKPDTRQETYHGVPVLEMRVGDPVPTPRAPTRYAVRVTPDLARHLLTLNVEHNRRRRERAVHRYSRLMMAGLWRFTPESLMFSVSGRLHNGQNRLMAVSEAGIPVWLMVDLGWPDDITTAVDQGERRTNSDALGIHGVADPRLIASLVALWHRYRVVRDEDPRRGFASVVALGAPEVRAIYEEDPEGWALSASWGRRAYDALDKGATAPTWGAAHRVIALARSQEDADAYLRAIIEGTGAPRSATRTVRDWFFRRKLSATRTGDSREPLENIVRGFNAWAADRHVALVSRGGFDLTGVR